MKNIAGFVCKRLDLPRCFTFPPWKTEIDVRCACTLFFHELRTLNEGKTRTDRRDSQNPSARKADEGKNGGPKSKE